MIAASRNLPEAYDWAKTLKGQDGVAALVGKKARASSWAARSRARPLA